MLTRFKTSVELPVGRGPTGGCAYCACTVSSGQWAVSSRSPTANTARLTNPTNLTLKSLLTKLLTS
jgi:hypothetical protein